MQYALLIVEFPASVWQATAEFHPFGQDIEGKLTPDALAGKLNAGAYLLPLEHGLHDLTTLVAVAKSRRYLTRTPFFEDEPPFVVTKP